MPSALDVPTGELGCDFEVYVDGRSGGKEFLPIKLFNILPATLNTDIFLILATSCEVNLSGFCEDSRASSLLSDT